MSENRTCDSCGYWVDEGEEIKTLRAQLTACSERLDKCKCSGEGYETPPSVFILEEKLAQAQEIIKCLEEAVTYYTCDPGLSDAGLDVFDSISKDNESVTNFNSDLFGNRARAALKKVEELRK